MLIAVLFFSGFCLLWRLLRQKCVPLLYIIDIHMKTTKQLLCVGGLLWLGAVAQAQGDPDLIDVTSLEQLDAIRYDLNGDGIADDPANATAYETAFPSLPLRRYEGYELTTNLDFAGTKWAEDCASGCVTGTQADRITTGNIGWDPIGDLSSPFVVIFEGNDNTISNLYIDRAASYIGLFSSLGSYGTVRNLGIVGGSVTGSGDVGGLVGYNRGSISACYATGNATAATSYSSAGGLVGTNNSGSISASYATGNATALEGYAGGLVGYNSRGTISASYATGNAEATSYGNVGGLLGYNNNGSISGSYATGNATATGADSRAGGLLGYNNNGSISGSYATGNATATGANGSAGGLVGENDNNSTISASYATGNATATGANGSAGGLVGFNDDANRIEASYFDSDASNRPGTDLYAKTTSELQSPMAYSGIYEEWDVVHTWNGGEFYLWALCGGSEYPTLYVDFDGNGTPTLAEFGSQSSCAQAPTCVFASSAASTIEGRVTALETRHDTEIAALEASQGTQDTEIEALKGTISALEAKIAAFEAATGGQSTAIYNVPGVSASARVYPNPAKHSLLFANLTPGRVYLYKIYTSSGVLLRSDAVQSDEAIDISTLEAGQHLLVLQDDDSREVLRSSLLIE